LSEEKKLGQDADRLEDLREIPNPLRRWLAAGLDRRNQEELRTVKKDQLLSKISIAKGDNTSEPARIAAPSFQAISRSLVRG
jgi:hypothetical protein